MHFGAFRHAADPELDEAIAALGGERERQRVGIHDPGRGREQRQPRPHVRAAAELADGARSLSESLTVEQAAEAPPRPKRLALVASKGTLDQAYPPLILATTAASLGCRFATSFRAVVDQGRVAEGEWLAVHGCGGVGLSAIMIARALGAQVVAVDISDEKLALARQVGASATVNATTTNDVAGAVRDLTGGGAHVSLDAIGNAGVCFDSIDSLRKRGRHIQVGLMTGDQQTPRIPMHKVIANELEIRGSHGMQAHRYDRMLAMIAAGDLTPEKLIGRTIDLGESITALASMGDFDTTGVTIITRF